MRAFETFSLISLLDSSLSMALAFVLGTLIGMERQYRQRSAGLRTVVLVVLGAAGFVDLGQRIAGDIEAVRVISYVVSGIGFLGAGVIMKEGANVRGLNTAATLWCAAAVGACAGADLPGEAVMLTIFVLVVNTALRPLVDAINRIPIDERWSEATYRVRVTVAVSEMPMVREKLIDALERAKYPVYSISVHDLGGGNAEIAVTLVNTAVVPAELDVVTDEIALNPCVSHATWEGSQRD